MSVRRGVFSIPGIRLDLGEPDSDPTGRDLPSEQRLRRLGHVGSRGTQPRVVHRSRKRRAADIGKPTAMMTADD